MHYPYARFLLKLSVNSLLFFLIKKAGTWTVRQRRVDGFSYRVVWIHVVSEAKVLDPDTFNTSCMKSL